MLVIGTAGHIDHGKSAIVKRLSGTDPDRLPEEQARGMTIDLGFAFLKTPNGHELGMVDVPGHERFVRNMIAGAGGIEAVMLVIAADDGWMPQSEEHFQIIRLLAVRRGLIVINKIDLVEPDWLDLLESEIREKVAGSFLAAAPIIRVSAITGEGFEKLTEQLEQLAEQASRHDDLGRPRLYADRSFTRQGIGQVLGGTLRGGSLEVGQTVSLWPSRTSAKIRTLQSKGEECQKVGPGSRVALSLTGVDRKLMSRGVVVTARRELEYFAEREVLALSAELLKDSPIILENRRRALLLIGASETEGELRLLDKKQIRPGESGVIFFKPDDPIFTLVGDSYILRLITPMITLGGGEVLDHLEHFPRQRNLADYQYLKQRLSGNLTDLIASELKKVKLLPTKQLLDQTEYTPEQINQALEQLTRAKIVTQSGSIVYHTDAFAQATDQIRKFIETQLTEQPHLKGLPAEIIVRHSGLSQAVTRIIIDNMLAEKKLSLEGELYSLAGRGLALKGLIKQAYEEMIANLKADPYRPPTLANLAAGGKNHRQAIKYMIDTGEVYKCGSEYIFLKEAWADYLSFVRTHLSHHDQLTPADLRDKFEISRKWLIPILEETDRLGLTERVGDKRIKGRKF